MCANMSKISLCGIDPNAFRRSINVMLRGRLCLLALAMIVFSVRMCSRTPGIPFKKPFWSLESIRWFFSRYLSRWYATIRWNSFPTTDDRAMGR